MTDLTDDVVRQWLELSRGSPIDPSHEYIHTLDKRIIALAEMLLKERAANTPNKLPPVSYVVGGGRDLDDDPNDDDPDDLLQMLMDRDME